MFTYEERRAISEQIQRILRATLRPELDGDIRFLLHVEGSEPWSWADIKSSDSKFRVCGFEC